MTVSTSAADDVVTVLINDAAADDYMASIRKRFPDLRVLSAKDAASLDRHMAEADVLLAPEFPVDLFDKARRLRWFQCSNAGIDSILPVRDRIGDIVVTNARGIHGEIIADFVMAAITMMHWDFPRFIREQSRKEWHPRDVAPLAERTLGVVGLGSIGAAIAHRGKTTGMTVIGSKRDVTQPIASVDKLFPPNGLAELLQLSDFVVLAVPHVPETTKLIGREQLRLMRRTAFLVNIARGSVLVERELIEELRVGTISGALLDVFEREPLPADNALWTMPNVIVTPHVAGYPSDYATRVFEIFGDNLLRFLEKRPLRNVVDLKRGY
ncbi:D-2-hydroxyacid dehydrogenase [Bradyrhizobium sp. sBnM-33]|uniref:D-2-hydroxyacid dehydrogenase n=2 Tax=Bradyrhizobium sp. sBnM-33 TaxID=2831780 RepID=UPI001BD165A7|nr:D-2-hydroxyacid dehydrogenase [Bradyrhizobium sp. sBnM-33]